MESRGLSFRNRRQCKISSTSINLYTLIWSNFQSIFDWETSKIYILKASTASWILKKVDTVSYSWGMWIKGSHKVKVLCLKRRCGSLVVHYLQRIMWNKWFYIVRNWPFYCYLKKLIRHVQCFKHVTICFKLLRSCWICLKSKVSRVVTYMMS